MAITDWPLAERPREKLLVQGPEALSDAELLAIFLRVGIAGMDAVTLARQLLQHFGGLKPLLAASQTEFCQARGLGEAKYVQLQAVLELSRRFLQQQLQRDTVFSEPELVRKYLSHLLSHEQREVFMVLYLDNQHRMICAEPLFQGTIDACTGHSLLNGQIGACEKRMFFLIYVSIYF